MRLLPGMHIALWALADDARLGKDGRALIADEDNTIYVPTASIWEIAIKRALGRSAIPFGADAATDYFSQAGYLTLDVRPTHAAAVETLPKLHNDPFDRMLVAQALTEPMRLVTHDAMIAKYSTTVIHV
jgi:PIN domain nuclease of toxin-antitoxin system